MHGIARFNTEGDLRMMRRSVSSLLLTFTLPFAPVDTAWPAARSQTPVRPHRRTSDAGANNPGGLAARRDADHSRTTRQAVLRAGPIRVHREQGEICDCSRFCPPRFPVSVRAHQTPGHAKHR